MLGKFVSYAGIMSSLVFVTVKKYWSVFVRKKGYHGADEMGANVRKILSLRCLERFSGSGKGLLVFSEVVPFVI